MAYANDARKEVMDARWLALLVDFCILETLWWSDFSRSNISSSSSSSSNISNNNNNNNNFLNIEDL